MYDTLLIKRFCLRCTSPFPYRDLFGTMLLAGKLLLWPAALCCKVIVRVVELLQFQFRDLSYVGAPPWPFDGLFVQL